MVKNGNNVGIINNNTKVYYSAEEKKNVIRISGTFLKTRFNGNLPRFEVVRFTAEISKQRKKSL